MAAKKERRQRQVPGVNNPTSVENLWLHAPKDVLEMVMSELNPRDGLRFLTCSKSLMMGLGGESRVRTQRELVREIIHDERIDEELQRMDEYERNLELATAYYRKHNIRLREPGVSYSSVAKLFKILRCELIAKVENAVEEEMYELDSDDEFGNPDWNWLGGKWEG